MVFPFLVNPKVVDRGSGKGYPGGTKIYEGGTQSQIKNLKINRKVVNIMATILFLVLLLK